MKLILFLLSLSAASLVRKVGLKDIKEDLVEQDGELEMRRDWLLLFYEPSIKNRKLVDDFEGLAKQIKTEDIHYGSVSCKVNRSFCEKMEVSDDRHSYLFLKGERVY